jgi:hypothetical protein
MAAVNDRAAAAGRLLPAMHPDTAAAMPRHQQRAPAFARSSERRRVRASDARPGRADPDPRARPRPAASGTVDDAERRPDRQLDPVAEPGRQLLPAPGVHADLAPRATPWRTSSDPRGGSRSCSQTRSPAPVFGGPDLQGKRNPGVTDVGLLAMQKVVGSRPISRLESPANRHFSRIECRLPGTQKIQALCGQRQGWTRPRRMA